MDPFLGEIRPFAFNFAPRGWAFCAGQILPINQYAALFSILGTTYGGNGVQNFALPDLRGRVPIHAGSGNGLSPISLGQAAGSETVTLTPSQLASHNHPFNAQAQTANANIPAPGQFLAEGKGQGRGSFNIRTYAPAGTSTTLAPGVVPNAGSGGAHNNLQPLLVINWCIAMEGIFPTRN